MRLAPVLWLLAALLLSCDDGDAVGASPTDALPDMRLDLDAQTDGSPGDAGADAQVLGDFGSLCRTGNDCRSGYCVPGPDGLKTCTRFCGAADLCPEGWECRPVGNTRPDTVFICVAERHVQCLPCLRDGDCGSGEDLCLPIGRGQYCGRDCQTEACPEGYSCQDVQLGEQRARQCLPDSGSCAPCQDQDGDGYGDGGDCLGFDCDESDPGVHEGATERCDGLDNDCNPRTPDGEGDAPAEELTCLSDGLCVDTVPSCIQGAFACAYPDDFEVAGEVRCDGIDEDCDGETDEDFDLNANPLHCGGCNRPCVLAQAITECVEGQCVLSSCEFGWFDADGEIGNGCEYQCSATNNGIEQCDLIDNDCDGAIDEGFDLRSSLEHCGACNQRCQFLNGISFCDQGNCRLIDCAAGYYDIDAASANGCEYACTPSEDSVEICNSKDDNCDGRIDEGYDLLNNASHCGQCDRICSYPNASPVCDSGDCRMGECNPSFYDIDGSSSDGCEYRCVITLGGVEVCDSIDNDCDGFVDDGFDLTNDAQHCGGCSQVCNLINSQPLCVNGRCALGACLDGWVDADGDMLTGCEYLCSLTNDGVEICDGLDNDCDAQIDEDYDLTSDLANCGVCGNVCILDNAEAECSLGQCVIDNCQEGFRDLDDEPENGCEYECTSTNDGVELCDTLDNDCDGVIDEGFELQRDPANCGQCSTVCAFENATALCQAGECVQGTCSPGFHDLDAQPGCEYACQVTLGGQEACDRIDNDCDGQSDEGFDLTSDEQNCGSCGRVCQFLNGFAECHQGVCELIGCRNGAVNADGNDENGCELNCSLTNGGVEICDSIDNDCDASTDEGFDLQNDEQNCGQCGRICQFDHASEVCERGQCLISACDTGFVNQNGLSQDGCEYACTLTNGGVDICDQVDNDCDGQVDEGYDLLFDEQNCGTCGRVCAYQNGLSLCQGGFCFLDACLPGFVDLDRQSANGCEYACTTSGPEICDDRDNDCDGVIDEGYDLAGSVDNCGVCGFVCELDNAAPICLDGRCEVGACAAGFVDLDGTADNGCEYACSINNGGVELCNLQDDDCDGQIDEGAEEACERPNSVMACMNGACVFDGCDEGWQDLDGLPANGCEYACAITAGYDYPDPLAVDANCDGVDGQVSDAIFVSATGNDTWSGTRALPIRTIGRALVLAQSQGKHQVLIARGTYAEIVLLRNGVGLFGGYDLAFTRNLALNTTLIDSSSYGVYGVDVRQETILQGLSIVGRPTTGTAYGVYLRNSPGVLIENCVIEAKAGLNGRAGTPGTAGAIPVPTSERERGRAGCSTIGCGSLGEGSRAPGGVSPCGGNGGRGGLGGYSAEAGTNGERGAGTAGGLGGAGTGYTDNMCGLERCEPSNPGVPGQPGAHGDEGHHGGGGDGGGRIVNNLWNGTSGANGGNGTAGSGGGGGGGAGGVFCCIADRGGSGGGGGAGGCAGTSGTAGTGGGGSFAVFLVDSSVILRNNTLKTGRGGNGGQGGSGGQGSNGQQGGLGGSDANDAAAGGNGGLGGNGGHGGCGGGGGGGASYGIYRAGTSAPISVGNTFSIAGGGQGGAACAQPPFSDPSHPGTAGNAGRTGGSGQIY